MLWVRYNYPHLTGKKRKTHKISISVWTDLHPVFSGFGPYISGWQKMVPVTWPPREAVCGFLQVWLLNTHQSCLPCWYYKLADFWAPSWLHTHSWLRNLFLTSSPLLILFRTLNFKTTGLEGICEKNLHWKLPKLNRFCNEIHFGS